MGQKNYETAVEGKNGFVCLVGRAQPRRRRFLLACVIVVVAMLTAADLAARLKAIPNSEPTLSFLVVPFVDAFDFAALAGFAYALRKNATAHKRLIIIATAGISGAAFVRWHVAILFHDGYTAYAASYVFLLQSIR
jgi:hypothetical protein